MRILTSHRMDGTEIVFRRFVKNGAKEYPQIAVIAVGGGQARILTDGDSIAGSKTYSTVRYSSVSSPRDR